MHEALAPARRLRLPGLLLLLLLASGCAQVEGWLRGDRGNERGSIAATGTPDADGYLHDMYRLASGDPATKADIYADAEAAATLTPDPSTRLRYALVLAVPGHPGANAEQAQDLLRELLSQSELLTASEVALATVHLLDVEQRLVLDRETERLRAASARTNSSEQRAIEQRIANVEAENRRLRQSLAEAETKLEAITTIERSIREQADNGDNPP